MTFSYTSFSSKRRKIISKRRAADWYTQDFFGDNKIPQGLYVYDRYF